MPRRLTPRAPPPHARPSARCSAARRSDRDAVGGRPRQGLGRAADRLAPLRLLRPARQNPAPLCAGPRRLALHRRAHGGASLPRRRRLSCRAQSGAAARRAGAGVGRAPRGNTRRPSLPPPHPAILRRPGLGHRLRRARPRRPRRPRHPGGPDVSPSALPLAADPRHHRHRGADHRRLVRRRRPAALHPPARPAVAGAGLGAPDGLRPGARPRRAGARPRRAVAVLGQPQPGAGSLGALFLRRLRPRHRRAMGRLGRLGRRPRPQPRRGGHAARPAPALRPGAGRRLARTPARFAAHRRAAALGRAPAAPSVRAFRHAAPD